MMTVTGRAVMTTTPERGVRTTSTTTLVAAADTDLAHAPPLVRISVLTGTTRRSLR